MIPDVPDIDTRPSLLLGWSAENISCITQGWPRSNSTPDPVADLLAEATRLFVGSSTCYDNLTAASLKALQALQAAEHGLRLLLDIPTDAKRTLGQLLRNPGIEDVLNPTQHPVRPIRAGWRPRNGVNRDGRRLLIADVTRRL